MTDWPTTTARDIGTHVITVAEDTRIVFNCVYHAFTSPQGYSLIVPQLYARHPGCLENWPVLPAENDVSKMPVEFSACLCAMGPLLFYNHGKNRVYEGDKDMVIDARGVIQSTAARFGVNPDEMMRFYSLGRTWLSVDTLRHPLTIDELLGNLTRQGKVELRQ